MRVELRVKGHVQTANIEESCKEVSYFFKHIMVSLDVINMSYFLSFFKSLVKF